MEIERRLEVDHHDVRRRHPRAAIERGDEDVAAERIDRHVHAREAADLPRIRARGVWRPRDEINA